MTHHERLIRLYKKAPIHDFYQGLDLQLEAGKAVITLPVDARYFHGGMAVHGSVYFKLLDDAAYFACQTMVHDFFILTTNFNISLRRPITAGLLTATGLFESVSDNVLKGTATLTDDQGKVCGTGTGEFMKSKTGLGDLRDY